MHGGDTYIKHYREFFQCKEKGSRGLACPVLCSYFGSDVLFYSNNHTSPKMICAQGFLKRMGLVADFQGMQKQFSCSGRLDIGEGVFHA